MKTQLRQILILIHRWIGILVGLFVCIIGLTGSFLVVQDRVVYGHTWSLATVFPIRKQ